MRREAEQALGSLKKKSALGSDGLTAAAMCWCTFGAASSIGAGGMGGFLLSGGKV